MGRLSHYHEGLLDAIAKHATSMVQVQLLGCTSKSMSFFGSATAVPIRLQKRSKTGLSVVTRSQHAGCSALSSLYTS